MNKPAERELIKAFRNKGSVPSTMKLEVLVYSAQFISKIFTQNGRNSYEYHVWLPTLSIMAFNYLLIPVNIDNRHWVLIVIRPLLQSIKLYDSIGGNPNIYFEPLKRWLSDRLKVECSGWKCSFYNCLNVDGQRQQQDGYNCGCYVINNARKAVGFRTDNGCERKDLAIDVLRGFI
jgi:Ulp1 family protease